MKFTGKVWKFGDNVNTDEILAARYLVTVDPEEMGRHLMEDIRPGFSGMVSAGDLIVGGENFGCGSSREHAPLAIKGAGISAVVAAGYARIFYRNAFNMGLPIFESPAAAAALSEGDRVEIDVGAGIITDLDSGKFYRSAPVPDFMQDLIRAGGLINYIKSHQEKKPE